MAASEVRATRSPTPYPLTAKPNLISAETLSPSVTATWRILSPKRANFAPCRSCHARAARIQAARRSWTSGSAQWPTTTLRPRRMRVWMNPASRSPWADWLRFMKSMSISPHGRSRLNCVWRWTNGLRSAERPPIHIFEGEKVCIHRMRPAQFASWFASRQSARISSGVVSSALNTTCNGMRFEASRASAILVELAATCLSGPGP